MKTDEEITEMASMYTRGVLPREAIGIAIERTERAFVAGFAAGRLENSLSYSETLARIKRDQVTAWTESAPRHVQSCRDPECNGCWAGEGTWYER